jgi:hypothetical protein
MLLANKHVDATIQYEVDFANNLAQGETLSNASVTVETADAGTPSDLNVSNVTVSGTTVQFTLAGGTAGSQAGDCRWITQYCLTVSVDTSSGETEAETVTVNTYHSKQV